ncbi:GNAT family N-acetyltransferase [Pseudoalteromonas sp. T1lg65]|uniref:GNAT family N-acetyltransferase n=1 Tax=Pseudoalteromonas sp. T1lg65 TaxID=2077101 RepID=UPI003F79C7B9
MSVSTSEPTIQVKYIAPEDINVAGSLLYKAYHDDPLLKQVLEAKAEREFEKKLRALIREELLAFSRTGQPVLGLYDGERLLAVACVIADGHELEASRQWHWRLRLMMSAGFLQTQQLIDKEKMIRDALVELEPYHFLSLIAVDPQMQGQGLGHCLLSSLDDLLDRSDHSKGIAVLITQAEQGPFFEGHGYTKHCELKFKAIDGVLYFKSR